MLRSVIDLLEKHYGSPSPPRITDPFEMILLENVAYLVDDARREKAFAALKANIGTTPIEILNASPEGLNSIAELGRANEHGQIAKPIEAARIAIHDFNGKLSDALQLPVKDAIKALRKFPAIGEPGAQKILLFNKRDAVLAIESNGLRVLNRIGFGEESSNYAANYRAVQTSLQDEILKDCDWLIRAHLLLRAHGKETCRRSRPACGRCVLRKLCNYARNSQHA